MVLRFFYNVLSTRNGKHYKPKIIIEWRGIGNFEDRSGATDSNDSDDSDNRVNSEGSDNSAKINCSLSERLMLPNIDPSLLKKS